MAESITYSSVPFSIFAALFIINSRLRQIKNANKKIFKNAVIFNHRINLQR
jgi:hypothetical protein